MRCSSFLCGRRVELSWLQWVLLQKTAPGIFWVCFGAGVCVWIPDVLERLLLLAQHVLQWELSPPPSLVLWQYLWKFSALRLLDLVTRTTGFISRQAHHLFKKTGSYLQIEEYWFWKVVNISACWITWEVRNVQLKGKELWGWRPLGRNISHCITFNHFFNNSLSSSLQDSQED